MSRDQKQLSAFTRTKVWIEGEFSRQLGRRCSRSRTRALHELSARAAQLLKEYGRWEVRAGLAKGKSGQAKA